jgi:hypothetical protein
MLVAIRIPASLQRCETLKNQSSRNGWNATVPLIVSTTQLFVDHRLHLFPVGNTRELAAQRVAVGDPTVGDGSDLGKLQIAQRELARLGLSFSTVATCD